MGVKQTRTKILLSLFLLSDINFSPVIFDERITKIFDLSLNEKTRGTLSGLLKESYIEKESAASVKNARQEIHLYRLTEKGFAALCLEFPFFRFLKEAWDGRWRIISYEIPESKREIRDRLRREMQGWGLGPWHRSFWLTPHPIIENLRQLVSGKEEERYIQAFEASHVFGDRETLIEKVWEKTKLDKSYRELFKKWHEILSSSEEKLQKIKKIIENYLGVLRIDPGLPQELIGKSWIGFEGWNIYKEIRSILIS
jgi:phenylacetic acid degradation operon negative regulatory protein